MANIYTEEAKKETYSASLVNGGKVIAVKAIIEAPGAKSGDVIRFFKDLDANLVPIELKIANSASLGTIKVGAFYPNGGAAIDDDVLGASIDTSTPGKAIDCLNSVTVANMTKSIAELCGIDETKFPGVDIGVTVAASVTTSVVLYGLFLQK